MKTYYLAPLFCSGVLLLGSCQDSKTSEAATATAPPALQQPPPPPREEIVTALKQQEFGSKLLGRTHYLVKGEYILADLQKAPRYYLLNFSGSF